MKTYVISIPVHESFECIINHIENIKKFCPEIRAIVLHISGDSPDILFSNLIKESKNNYSDFLFINPNRHKSHKLREAGNVTGLSTIFADNFSFISSLISFDAYAIETSNELFVRKGYTDIINSYDCCFNYTQRNTRISTQWDQFIEKEIGLIKYHEFNTIEGCFFPSEVFKECSTLILEKLSHAPIAIKNYLVDSQEYIIPTLILNLYPELYNKCLKNNMVMCDPYRSAISTNIISEVKRGIHPNKFIVKRIPRKINDSTRIFVNNLNESE